MILHTENPKDATRKQLEIVRDRIQSTQKSLTFHTLMMKDQKEKFRKQCHLPFTSKRKKKKNLGISLHRGQKTWTLKTLRCWWKKSMPDRWKDTPSSWIGRINIVKMTILPKAIRFNCNPYQISNGIFHRTRFFKFILYVNIKDLKDPKQS